MKLNPFYVDDIIKTALLEDINYIDTSADLVIEPEQISESYFQAKADGVLCGLDIALRVFMLLDPTCSAVCEKQDGDEVHRGEVIARMKGHTVSLLKGERTALNLLQHMSGIATATRRAVRLVEGTKASVADTRKTLPGLRPLQKYAVPDAAMLKDNHIDAAGSITAAITKLRQRAGHMVKIEVETRNLQEVQEALDVGADVIMLDNMDVEQMRRAVELNNGRALLEASGNITDQTIAAVAQTGVDIISIGALTHSVQAFDISMKIK